MSAVRKPPAEREWALEPSRVARLPPAGNKTEPLAQARAQWNAAIVKFARSRGVA